MNVRADLIRHIHAALDRTDATDEDGYPIMWRDIDEDPYTIPDYSDSSTAAVIADEVLAWLAKGNE